MLKKRLGDEDAFCTYQSFGAGRCASSDAIPDAAGGEDGHRAAKLYGVIHRCRVNNSNVSVSCDFGLVDLEPVACCGGPLGQLRQHRVGCQAAQLDHIII